MKLHDTNGTNPEDDLRELLPWYVNGTLPEAEVARIEAFAQANADFRAEIALEQKLAEKVAKADPFDAPAARNWETLRAQVEADAQARAPARRGWLGGLQGRGWVVPATAFAACCVLVIGIQFNRGSNDFSTLTSGSDSDVPIIKFTPVEGISATELEVILAELGATLSEGPSEGGVYTATLSDEAQMQAVVDELMARDEIVFAAPEQGQ